MSSASIFFPEPDTRQLDGGTTRVATYETSPRRYYTEPRTASSDVTSARFRSITASSAAVATRLESRSTQYRPRSPSTRKRLISVEDADDGRRQGVETRRPRQRLTLSHRDLIAKEERLREQRRQCQLRYRKRKQDYEARLLKETALLRDELQQLEKQYIAANATVTSDCSVWDAAVAYFLLFRHGYQASQPSEPTLPSPELDALSARMSPGVVFNGERGVEAMERYWRRCSLWFGDVELKLVKLQMGPTGDLEAVTSTSFNITERTLRNVFPHLQIGEEDQEKANSNLANKLLGQRITVHGRVVFGWYTSVCVVTRVTSESDLLTPMLRLLGNLEDVARVFNQALISPDFRWKSVER